MSKAKLSVNIRILDLNRIEEMKRLINELLDTIETLRITAHGCNEDNGFEIHEIMTERKLAHNRHAVRPAVIHCLRYPLPRIHLHETS